MYHTTRVQTVTAVSDRYVCMKSSRRLAWRPSRLEAVLYMLKGDTVSPEHRGRHHRTETPNSLSGATSKQLRQGHPRNQANHHQRGQKKSKSNQRPSSSYPQHPRGLHGTVGGPAEIWHCPGRSRCPRRVYWSPLLEHGTG